jgi:hypothetical protein|tara:strand:- start:2206 stop:2625 length:420 start_codon:yes stop_codon:yes gene_type:complete
MGFFTKKKEENKPSSLPFPDFPKYESNISTNEVSQIKDAVSSAPSFTPHQDFEPDFNEHNVEHHDVHRNEKTLFIKIDKYKSIMRSLDDIKGRIEDIQKVIVKLEEIKKEEDSELSKWHSDLESLKEKLTNIDETLFEN